MSLERDELRAWFTRQSDHVTDCLSELLELTRSGGMMPEEHLQQLITDIHTLRETYDSLYANARTLSGEEELPPYGSPIDEVLTIAEENHARQLQTRLEETEEALRSFIRIRSSVEVYANALTPYQARAREDLAQLGECTLEEALSKAQGPSIFLEAMNPEHMHTPEWFQLLDQVHEYFPETVIQTGLPLGMYYMEEPLPAKAADPEEKEDSADSASLPTDPAPKKPAEPAIEQENEPTTAAADAESAPEPTPADDMAGEETSCPAADESPEESDVTAEEAQIPEEEPEPESEEDLLEPTDDFLEDDDCTLKLKVLNKIITSAPSASSFKKDIVPLAKRYPLIRFILPMFTHMGVLDKENICTILSLVGFCKRDDKSQRDVGRAVDALVARGYLADIDHEDMGNGTFYCLSGYCAGCLHKNTISQQMKGFWKVSFGSFDVSAVSRIDAAVFYAGAANSCTMVCYLTALGMTYPEINMKTIFASLKWTGDHFQILAPEGEEWKTAALYYDLVDFSSMEEPHLIIVEGSTVPEPLPPGCTGVTAVIGTRLYACDLALDLQTQMDAFRAAAATEAPETGTEETEEPNPVMNFPETQGEEGTSEELPSGQDGSQEEEPEAPTEMADSHDPDTSEPGPKPAEETSKEELTGPEAAEEEKPAKSEATAEEESDPLEGLVGEGNETEPVPGLTPDSDRSAEDEQDPALSYADTEPDSPVQDAAPPEASNKSETTTPPETVLSPQDLLDLGRTPTDEEFSSVIHALLGEGTEGEDALAARIVNADLLALGAGLEPGCPNCSRLSAQLRLATRLLLRECSYSSKDLSQAFPSSDCSQPTLKLAAYLYAMLTPAEPYDFTLTSETKLCFSQFDTEFPGLDAFKQLFNLLLRVRDVRPSGFTPAVIASLGNADKGELFMHDLGSRAKNYLILNIPQMHINALPDLYSGEFGKRSDLYTCMQIIADEKTDLGSMEFIEAVLGDYCTPAPDGSYEISDDKISDRLDEAWASAMVSQKGNFKLNYAARELTIRQYKQRLDVMLSWTELIQSRKDSQENVLQLQRLRGAILDQLNLIGQDDTWTGAEDRNVLEWLLLHMADYLNGTVSNLTIFQGLTYTGIFSQEADGTPIVEESLAAIRYYEVWRNALRHIVAPRRSAETVKSEILGTTPADEAGLQDNLHQLILLGQLLEEGSPEYTVSDHDIAVARNFADSKASEFRDNLELAYTYYQIDETEKEDLTEYMTQYRRLFYETHDFARWRRFLEALGEWEQEMARKQRTGLEARLSAKLEENSGCTLLLGAKHMLEDEGNFSVAEEYLNRYDAGERDLDSAVDRDEDYFDLFLSGEVYDPLLLECRKHKGGSLRNFGWNYLEHHLPKNWTSRLISDSRALISNWPTRRDTSNPSQVRNLFRGLGLDVTEAARVNGQKEETWRLTVTPTPRSREDYLHPIAAFGTQIQSPVYVVFMYGNHTERQIVDNVTSMNLGGMAMVLLDDSLDQPHRRQIGELFRTQTSGQNPFLLIDRVLFLYLATLQETERLPALLKCTLPFTAYQPFLRDGGTTADEMFFGRRTELNAITQLNGACVVYGGRQLGKTALLKRAESCCSKPEDKKFAVYTTILNMDSQAEVVQVIVNDINKKTDGKIHLNPCTTIQDMCTQLDSLFRNGRINTMHLLIDEVDTFLETIAPDGYRPLQPLVDLRRETKNSFKFVLTGLHNVCRAKNATRNNGIFGQLGTPLCIKPLTPTDALQLLSRPLGYLGFRIKRYPHLETILTNTNYYPGVLQFFGHILVETLNSQYTKYYTASGGNPPFSLQDEQLGAIMNSSDLNNSIKDKFRLSLELDPRYYMIAGCITMLYHLHEKESTAGNWLGSKVQEIKELADDYFGIHCLAGLSLDAYIVLLDEMVEMGILGTPQKEEHIYRLRRSSFVDLIGRDMNKLDAEIKAKNEEV